MWLQWKMLSRRWSKVGLAITWELLQLEIKSGVNVTLFNPVPALADQHGPPNIPYTIKYIHPNLDYLPESICEEISQLYPNTSLNFCCIVCELSICNNVLACKKEKREHIKVVAAAWDRNLWGCLLPLKEKSLTAHAQTFPNIHIIFNLSGQLARRKWSWGIYFH